MLTVSGVSLYDPSDVISRVSRQAGGGSRSGGGGLGCPGARVGRSLPPGKARVTLTGPGWALAY